MVISLALLYRFFLAVLPHNNLIFSSILTSYKLGFTLFAHFSPPRCISSSVPLFFRCNTTDSARLLLLSSPPKLSFSCFFLLPRGIRNLALITKGAVIPFLKIVLFYILLQCCIIFTPSPTLSFFCLICSYHPSSCSLFLDYLTNLLLSDIFLYFFQLLHFLTSFPPPSFLSQMRSICWSVSGCRVSATMIKSRYGI